MNFTHSNVLVSFKCKTDSSTVVFSIEPSDDIHPSLVKIKFTGHDTVEVSGQYHEQFVSLDAVYLFFTLLEDELRDTDYRNGLVIKLADIGSVVTNVNDTLNFVVKSAFFIRKSQFFIATDELCNNEHYGRRAILELAKVKIAKALTS